MGATSRAGAHRTRTPPRKLLLSNAWVSILRSNTLFFLTWQHSIQRHGKHGAIFDAHSFRLQVIDETGKPISPSKLTAPQMRVELEARGLMTEGTRREVYKRVQVCALFDLHMHLPPQSDHQRPLRAKIRC